MLPTTSCSRVESRTQGVRGSPRLTPSLVPSLMTHSAPLLVPHFVDSVGHVTDAYVVFSNETNSGQALAAAREARYGSHTVERHATTTHTTSNQRQQTVQQSSDAMSARSVGVVDREVASEYRSSVGEGAAASVAESVHTARAPSVPQLHNISPETRGGRSMAGFTALSSVRSSASHGGGHVAREADVVPRLQLKQRLAVLKENEAAAMSVSQLSDRRQQFRQYVWCVAHELSHYLTHFLLPTARAQSWQGGLWCQGEGANQTVQAAHACRRASTAGHAGVSYQAPRCEHGCHGLRRCARALS